MKKEFVKQIQKTLNQTQNENLVVDGDWGPKTQAAFEKYDFIINFLPKPPQEIKKESEKKEAPPWYTYAKKFMGKKETDSEFAKFMIPKWSLVGLNLNTIATSWAAWCGLAMAVALSGVGIDYAKNGALAKNWGSYGIEINWERDGIPQGAIVHINGSGDCKSSKNNHVAQANGYCTSKDLLKPGATIDLYGGNQGNTWKVSTYSASKICAVRWPKDYEKPGPVSKSDNCSAKSASNESTR